MLVGPRTTAIASPKMNFAPYNWVGWFLISNLGVFQDGRFAWHPFLSKAHTRHTGQGLFGQFLSTELDQKRSMRKAGIFFPPLTAHLGTRKLTRLVSYDPAVVDAPREGGGGQSFLRKALATLTRANQPGGIQLVVHRVQVTRRPGNPVFDSDLGQEVGQVWGKITGGAW